MKYLVCFRLCLALSCLTLVNAGVIPSIENPITSIQGPSSQSKIMGPDGSVITAETPGGQIIHREPPGVFAPAGHFLGPANPLVNPSAVPGMAAHRAVDAALEGPSGTLAAGHYVARTAEDTGRSAMGGM